ncbi:O-linked N-acetylglucosamine transferase, SPINDLY family protein [filamentous cyanobacterium LEGE 11480]|uniref:O-linked N-acetylglucosamine transferase, SPINDLY family protein n=1 Tax=Romeriopsis navalis LEGE 11480 TaxID=2777977 RepID=A0A928VPN2_9CYAN|nr:O-linked N-acetylglucosamine transferase, SPINDLY family protein [Romeriopsis navalis]MBE9031452.1 O-linked N-acetylglucosamine transferase, SPINDLY family protein [Romeriopsis navalis LEGE 11480]
MVNDVRSHYQSPAEMAVPQAIDDYTEAIEADPTNLTNYWYLGLSQLLNQQEAEAQTTWMAALMEAELPEAAAMELAQVLDLSAQDLSQQSATLESAWLVRQHLRELLPEQLDNLLRLLPLSAQLQQLCEDDLVDWDLAAILQAQPEKVADQALVSTAVRAILEHLVPTDNVFAVLAACGGYIGQPAQLMPIVIPRAIRLAYAEQQVLAAIELTELYLTWDPGNTEALAHLASFYQNAQMHDRGIEVAQQRVALTTHPPDQAFSNHLLLRGLLGAGGYWDEAIAVFHQQEALLLEIAQSDVEVRPIDAMRLISCNYYLAYLRDDFKRQRAIQNAILARCQATFRQQHQAVFARYQAGHQTRKSLDRPLRIGYLSHCMRRHSVGWLARWLIQHHDRQRFDFYGYFINPRTNDELQGWYTGQFDQVRSLGLGESPTVMAEQIFQDEIDILIDLDSITLDTSCEILSLKPAPVQVTWLGWDASGLPAIDYYITDRYVMTEDAQSHYTEKLWQMSQSYLAVDGFEVGVPTLSRPQLDIPDDAIVYLSAQRGYKRHADTVRLQMEIIRQVPNSYFLIKGFADQGAIQDFFTQIARDVGVEPERLRFLPDAPSEAVHRANMTIADVILDTYPYNGATTTLEALWMERPLVTYVGNQFVARNSYTMLKNVGVEAGLAFSETEYIEWGVRLGTDLTLRQQVAWQLRQSKRSAPLWNTAAFTREIEQAYTAMWDAFLAQPTVAVEDVK